MCNLEEKNKSNVQDLYKIYSRNIREIFVSTSTKPAAYYSLEITKELDSIWNQNNYEILKEFLDEYLVENDVEIEYLSTFDNFVITYNDEDVSVDVKISPEEDTVWMSQNAISKLFKTTQPNVSMHIKNILKDKELDDSVYKDFLYTGKDSKKYQIRFYNLDMILSIGYRIKSKSAVKFRIWASKVLKEYLIKGYSINAKRLFEIDKVDALQIEYESIKKQLVDLKIDNRVEHIELDNKIKDLEKKTFITPIKEKVLVNGEYYDAYEFVSKLLMTATSSLIIIDPYFDITGLNMLTNVNDGVSITICGSKDSKLKEEELELFLSKYNKDIKYVRNNTIHDRFLIIDDKDCYSLGSSLNRIGNKVSSIIKINDIEIIDYLYKKIR